MRLLSSSIVFALVGLLVANPTFKDNDTDVITQSSYLEDYVKYEGKHDIVKILVPLNSLNFDEDRSTDDMLPDFILFFVEADVQPDGILVDQGLYVFKQGKAKKILDYGRDAAASVLDESKIVFFGAKDGLYVYNVNANSADKYGSISDSIVGIATEDDGNVIYILTADHEIYKVTNRGKTKAKMEDIKAQQIVLDYSNNLYFCSDDKKLYVLKNTGIKEIEGLPKHYSSVRLNKPPYVLEDSVPVFLDNNLYFLFANGTSERHGVAFKPKAIIPTASALEAAFIQYHAHNKKIYEYNILSMISDLSDREDLSSYLSDKASDIRSLALKPIGQTLHSNA